jgi:hypothetical protein
MQGPRVCADDAMRAEGRGITHADLGDSDRERYMRALQTSISNACTSKQLANMIVKVIA